MFMVNLRCEGHHSASEGQSRAFSTVKEIGARIRAVTSAPAGNAATLRSLVATATLPAPAPEVAPMAAPFPPPMMAPRIAPTAAPPPIFVALLFPGPSPYR